MANFKAFVSIGLVGCKREEEFWIDDEDLEGLSPSERNDLLYREAEEMIMSNGNVEIWYEEDN
jgi:hypothetical protein